MRTIFHWVITAAVLAACNAMILQKQRLVDHGAVLLLKLAPVDPRSLIQGDYMALRYEIARDHFSEKDAGATRGEIVVRADGNGVATFVRFHANEPLAAGEHLLKFRRRENDVRLGAEAFFFQEGDAAQFQSAKYGELKVASDGSSVLVGLRDANLQPLGATPAAKTNQP